MSEHAAPFANLPRPTAECPSTCPEWRPFPLDALPEPIAHLATEGGRAIGCDPVLVALPALVAAAAAIGNSRTIELKVGWREPAILNAAIVAESGGAKSPALDLALAPSRHRDEIAQREHADALAAYAIERQRYEARLAEWKRVGASGDPPRERERPRAPRFVIADVTVEAVARLLVENPRGLLLARDELSGFLRSFDAYRGGKGGDVAFWLAAYGARPHSVDRKGDPPTLYVSRASVSIVGGIPPAALAACLAREHLEDGLAARFLYVMPPRSDKRWTTATVGSASRLGYAQAIDDLFALEPRMDEDGFPEPVPMLLADDAAREWEGFYNRFAARQAAAIGSEAAALAKLEGAAARLALVHQLVRDPTARAIDANAIQAGARLAEWFADEAVRVHAVLRESPEAADRRRLVEWIAASPRDGRVSARELAKGPREYRRTGAAEDALAKLVSVGVGAWEDEPPGPRGGRPSRVFVLAAKPGADGTSGESLGTGGGGETSAPEPTEAGSAAAATERPPGAGVARSGGESECEPPPRPATCHDCGAPTEGDPWCGACAVGAAT